jgi:hypothetical protein
MEALTAASDALIASLTSASVEFAEIVMAVELDCENDAYVVSLGDALYVGVPRAMVSVPEPTTSDVAVKFPLISDWA